MATISTKGKYNIALGGNGFMLNSSNVTGVPAYRVDQSPAYGNRFAQGDRSYNDLSRWWYFAQTDWSGGITDFPSWEDSANFYYSTNLDVQSQPGSVLLEQQTESAQISNSTALKRIIYAKHLVVSAAAERLAFIDTDDIRWATDNSLIYSNSEVGEAVNFELFGDQIWIGHHSTSSTSSLFYTNSTTGAAATDITSFADSVVTSSVRKWGPMRVYSNYIYCSVISTNVFAIIKSNVEAPAANSDFSALVQLESVRSTSEIAGFEIIGSSFLVLLEDANIWTLYEVNISTGAYTVLYQTEGESLSKDDVAGGRFLSKLKDKVVITIPNNQDDGGRIFTYDGSTLTKVFSMSEQDKKYQLGTNESQVNLQYGGVVFDDKVYWGNLVYDGTYFYNFLKNNDDDTTDGSDYFIPIGVDISENQLLLVDTSNSGDYYNAYKYDLTTPSAYRDSGYLVFTNFDVISGIDKLAYSVTLNFQRLGTGGSIEVQYTTGELTSSTSWTSLGTASNTIDGGTVTTKKFLFGDAVTFKKIWFKVILSNASDNTVTPVLTDFIMEYLPVPNQTKTWSLNLNCGNEIFTLDGRPQDKTGRELRQTLESLWYKKELIEYQDIDYAETQLNGSITSSATTITVDDTTDLPEQGRITIENEEILYTGKTQTTITGCTRGARGSTAAAHNDNVAVRTGYYKVLITDFSATIPVLQKDKEIESVVSLTLRESSVA